MSDNQEKADNQEKGSRQKAYRCREKVAFATYIDVNIFCFSVSYCASQRLACSWGRSVGWAHITLVL